MKKRVKTLNELKDSRLLFDKNPPMFGYFFILIITIFCVVAVILSLYVSKVYTIKASGLVTNENANYVMCAFTGEITGCNFKEGDLVEKGDVLFSVKSTDMNVQVKQLELSKSVYEKKIEKNELLVKSIKDDVNYFDESNPDDVLYYSMFENYKAQLKQNAIDASTYSAYGYTTEQIEGELEKNQGKLSQIYYETICNAENAISDANLQIESIDAQIGALTSGKSEYEVKANATGILHMMSECKEGMVVQTTQTIATITPENEKNIIESYISTADMARIHVGDKVQIVVDGLSQNVYGTLRGTVKSIDSNVTTRQLGDGSTAEVFKIIVSMDNDYLISQSGEKIDIVNGMTVVSRISYDKVSYFNYVLDKLGLKVRK